MIGVIPAAGSSEKMLACAKELLPVGSRIVDGVERPKAVSEYLLERMIAAGADQVCIVISPDKTDVIKYFAEREYSAQIFYAIQPEPRGLCDAVFRAEPIACGHEQVLIGMPDTIWFPENAYRAPLESLNNHSADIELLLFPVLNSERFDTVICDDKGYVQRVNVRDENPETHWIWGAFALTGNALRSLKRLWEARHKEDEQLGHLLNAFVAAGNVVKGNYAGEIYMDVGAPGGYQAAQDFLRNRAKTMEQAKQRQETIEAA